MFDNKYQSSGVETRPNTRQLFNLPKLSSVRKPPSFEIPAFPAAPEIRQGVCAVCGKRIEKDHDFLQGLNACRKCVGVYAAVGSLIDARSIEKTKTAKIAAWSKKLNAKSGRNGEW